MPVTPGSPTLPQTSVHALGGDQHQPDSVEDFCSRLTGPNDRYWANLTPDVRPSGVAASALKACYVFNDTSATILNDLSGNGVNLSVAAGNRRMACIESALGLLFDGVLYLTAGVNAAVQITGDMTVIVDAACYNTAAYGTVLSIEGAGAPAPANNILFQVRFEIDGDQRYLSEDGAGPALRAPTFTPDACCALGPPSQREMVTWTRDSGTTLIQQYTACYKGTTADPTANPTGGTSSYLTVGSREGGSSYFVGVLFGLQIYNVKFTDAQVAEQYQQLRGFSS